MARSFKDLQKQGINPQDIGNPRKRRAYQKFLQGNSQQNRIDRYLESQGLLAYQTGGQVNEQAIADALANVGIGAYQNASWNRYNPNYTVKQNDTIQTIADKNQTTPDAILQANPDLKTPKTGMVLRTPPVAGPSSQLGGINTPSVAGIGGLPSNAAIGATTNNPQGHNFGAINNVPAQQTPYAGGGGLAAPFRAPSTPSTQAQPTQAGLPAFRGAGGGVQQPGGGFGGLYNFWRSATNIAGAGANIMGPGTQTVAGATPVQGRPEAQQQAQQQAQQPTVANPYQPYKIDDVTYLWKAITQLDYTPTNQEIDMLLQRGYIAKNDGSYVNPGAVSQIRNALGGGYSPYRGGGGGGGGGRPRPGGGGGGYANQPAFSTGGGFRGLVNWRI